MDSSLGIEEDEEFLSQLAAAEALALSNKRQKLSSTTRAMSSSTKEGMYTAALRGSNSDIWKQQSQPKTALYGSKLKAVDQPEGGGGDACFKCGKPGHWAKDCAEIGKQGGSDVLVPEKKCPCGLGDCLVLTANTEKNRGRKFYRCSVREENGGCCFFEWCDNSSGIYSSTGGSQNYASNSLFPDLPCSCGSGTCLILTAKTEKNSGRHFYRCPGNQENSCGFFKWCNEDTVGHSLPINTSKFCNSVNDTNIKSYSAGTGSSCYKCGNGGHWAKDCPNPSSGSSTGSVGKSTSSGTCYKCGNEGHWAKDCLTPSFGSSAGSGGKSTSSGTCFKCGQSGHWARNCST